MTEKLQAQQLIASTKYGLQRIYTTLAQDLKGISINDLSNYSTYNKLAYTDVPFIELLQQNATNIDSNSDKKISEEELDKLISTIQNDGLTYQQLLSLASSSDYTGISKTLLETVLQNFNEIDQNRDGKVSEDEINYFTLNKEVEDKKDKFNQAIVDNMSLYYGSSTTDATETDNNSSDEESDDDNKISYTGL